MANHRLLSSLCYFSVFISPLLLPFIVYIVSDDTLVKTHAKRAFISHIIPVVILIAGFFIFSYSMMSWDTHMLGIGMNPMSLWNYGPFLFMMLYSLLFLAIIAWNVFQGVKIMK
ncbi:hypothetical protein [Sporosarcina sp. HYO08]|uniref:hypothetical protein n=1 Tax=Sporosarcina sp. HYO08 TaxID=1759557 RepID=UPI0007978A4C|nr:hypothetical protein [Sporosarcina sp. HYO08]KXH78815.1 hypothetical protein AU377_12505 [Sporosarcina sp. HYO08]